MIGLQSWKARYLFPPDGPPVKDGVLHAVDGKVCGWDASAPGGDVIDLGNAAIVAPLVNAHTHLEFSDLDVPIGTPGEPLPAWIRKVVAQRRAAADRQDLPVLREQALARGLAESSAAGVRLLGEIATAPWSYSPWQAADAAGVIFYELLGMAPQRQEVLLQAAREHLQAGLAWGPSRRAGLSPHAPYTVTPELTAAVCQLSAESGCPVAMHLAESPEELRLLSHGDGPFRDMLVELGAWRPDVFSSALRPLDYLRWLSRAERALVIHGNFLDAEEIAWIGRHRSRMTVVFCPRTHTFFQHRRYPLPEMLAAGIPVALGTDSRASNPDLQLWSEVQQVRRLYPEVPAAMILQMATVNGAAACGLFGYRLNVGDAADFTILDLPNDDAQDPFALLFDPRTSVRG
ncbi:amidohydrolase family protein [Lignipirellula cremea]|uniref:Aminodeoxyfutalosine deaminase n=1 Tax=Lignipirellula cremea TaxID=2528010 RepID=A0A518DYR1_9BACT|nr:amidohydrolase family protein [Lignipirellula cremea]QDU96976.1 Aminodeoxyfutalosine deaminase [Lignipirellula cremea]